MKINIGKIIKIEEVKANKKNKIVYDIEVEKYHNFAVNGIFVHNSTEDEQGIQLMGDAGQVLRGCLKELGLDLDRDFWKTNAVICRPTEGERNRTPTDLEIKCCRQNWVSVVKELKPHFIFLMGEKAVKSFFMFKGKKIREDLSISRFRKLCIPDLESGTQVICLYHPSCALRNPEVISTFKRDLKWAVGHLRSEKKKIFNIDFKSQVNSSTIFEEVIQRIIRTKLYNLLLTVSKTFPKI